MKAIPTVLVSVCACLLAGSSSGQTEAVGTAEAPDSAGTPFFVERDLVVRIGFGTVTYQADPDIPDPDGRTIFQLGMSAPLAAAPIVALDFDYFFGQRSFPYDHGITFPTYEDETEINLHAFTLGGRLRLPPGSPVHAYVTAGVALTLTQLRTTGTVEDVPLTSLEETDGGVAPMLGAGLQVFIGNIAFHAAYRRLSLRGQYEDFEIGDVELGGSFFVVGAGWRGPIPGLSAR